MDAILLRKARNGFYLAWAPLCALLAALLAAVGGLDWQTAVPAALLLCLAYAFICRSSWYLCRALPPRRAGTAVSIASLLPAAAAASLLWAGTVTWLSGRLPEDWAQDLASQGPLLFGFGVLCYLLSSAYHHLVLAWLASRNAERREMDARLAAREAELRWLRAQLNPHFLLNSLHSISALAGSDPSGARRMCELLGGFLRASLELTDRATIFLSEELDLARDYLAIERVRFGGRLSFCETVGEDCLDWRLPPLLLQPLVENAVKHGVAKTTGSADVRLEVLREGVGLKVIIDNAVDGENAKGGRGGSGLANVRQRLLATYGEAASLVTAAAHGRHRVELWLPPATEVRRRDARFEEER